MQEPSSDLGGGVAVADDPASNAPVNLDDLGVENDENTYQKKKLGWMFVAAVGWMVLLIVLAVLADVLPLKDPNKAFRGVSRTGPSAEHWFGGDNIGKDVFARTIYGARQSLAVAGTAALIGVFIGTVVGVVAGFYRGQIETFATGAIDVLLAFPALVLILMIVTFLGQSNLNVMLALAILSIPTNARIVRAATLVHSQREFVLASRTIGTRNKRIMIREILPNVLPAMFAYALINLAVLIVVQGSLAFLGIGDIRQPNWGSMISSGRDQMEVAPHIVLFPSLFMFLTILSLNLIGDKIREMTDVREASI